MANSTDESAYLNVHLNKHFVDPEITLLVLTQAAAPSPRPSPIEGEGASLGAAETFDNPVVAAAVTSAIGGRLRGEMFQGGLTGAAIGGVRLVGVTNN